MRTASARFGDPECLRGGTHNWTAPRWPASDLDSAHYSVRCRIESGKTSLYSALLSGLPPLLQRQLQLVVGRLVRGLFVLHGRFALLSVWPFSARAIP